MKQQKYEIQDFALSLLKFHPKFIYVDFEKF